MGNKNSRRPRALLRSGRRAGDRARGFSFPSLQYLDFPPLHFFMKSRTELRRGRGAPAAAGSKGTAGPGRAERRRTGGGGAAGEASSAAHSASPRCPPVGTHSWRGQGIGAPRDANGRLPTAGPCRSENDEEGKRERILIYIFFKITNTLRKAPTTKQTTSAKKKLRTKMTQPQQKPNLIYLSWPGRFLWSSLPAGWGLRGDARLVRSVRPLERHKARVPRGSPADAPGLGLGLAAGRAPRPRHIRRSGKAPQDPPVPSAVPDTSGRPTPPQLLKHGETLLLQHWWVWSVFCCWGFCWWLFLLRVCTEAEPRQPLPASWGSSVTPGAAGAPALPRRGSGARPERRAGRDASDCWVWESGWTESSLTRTFDLNLPPGKGKK